VGERFTARLNGGPTPGTFILPEEATWPLPKTIQVSDDGCYVKIMESQLPPQDEDSPIIRGAEYRWTPGILSVYGDLKVH
jgi:hypothetical protein